MENDSTIIGNRIVNYETISYSLSLLDASIKGTRNGMQSQKYTQLGAERRTVKVKVKVSRDDEDDDGDDDVVVVVVMDWSAMVDDVSICVASASFSSCCLSHIHTVVS